MLFVMQTLFPFPLALLDPVFRLKTFLHRLVRLGMEARHCDSHSGSGQSHAVSEAVPRTSSRF